jgi:tripeptidyl-peptidase-1
MSTPGHPKYGQHFQSHDEMKKMLLPSEEAISSVRHWLESAGIFDIEMDADWMNFRTTVDVASSLLDTEFKYYANEVKDINRLRTLQYSVPESVTPHVNMIQPTTRFGQIHPELPMEPNTDEATRAAALDPSNLPGCEKVITPQCLMSLYNFGDYQAVKESGSTLSFASYLGQSARYSDLLLFEQNIAPYALGQNFSVITYNGAENDQTSSKRSGEANLDLQYILGVGSPLPVTEFITAGRGPLIPDLSFTGENTNEPFLEFLQIVLKLDNGDLPRVISTSYGEDEQVNGHSRD